MRHRCIFRLTVKTIVLIALGFAHSMQLRAQTEKYIQILTGAPKKGDSCVVVDDKFRDTDKWATIEKMVSVDNLLTFELRYDTSANYFNRNFSCTLQVDLEYEKADKTKQQLHNISLELNYDTSRGHGHQGIAFYKFRDAHYVKLIIKRITSAAWGDKIPPVFRVRNEIFIERQYKLNKDIAAKAVYATQSGPAVAAKSNIATRIAGAGNNDLAGQQVTINWDGNDPAFPQYDFEWTFYDDHSIVGTQLAGGTFDFSPESLDAVFRNNSSRVTLSLPSYQLNIVYNKGWVFHRVRGVRYDETTGERTEGAWSYAGTYNANGKNWGLIQSEGHEPDLNWQYVATFAEEGKRKEITSYFDGSLRNRQSVTLNNDNTGSRAIVQENIFDAQGRSAVRVLPGPTEEKSIHYFHAFNKSNATGLAYSYADFDPANSCTRLPVEMSASSGASQYFSPLNPRKDDNSLAFYFTKYIPDAKGYPFAVTSFTPDNTGRIRAQGAVGAIFQPGASNNNDDHTTRYFYGKPQQQELDRLFGNEAGNATHYLKNMVTDANGQTSVTYINASGKTVATALAGQRPANLQAIPSYQLKNSTFITSLADRNNIVRDPAHLTLTYSGTFLAAATGNFTLKYAFTPLSLQVLYGVENQKICADCYYDLLVNVADNCGNTIQSVKQEAVFTEKTTCNPAPTEQQGSLSVDIPQPGEYNITYQLQLSRKAIDFYIDQYLVQNLSIKKEIDFQRDYLHQINIKGCFNNCATCLADLGTEENFVARMTGVLIQQDQFTPDAGDISWMKTLYHQLLDECSLLQQGCGQTVSPCEEQTLQLKDDVSPGGQYMLYDAATSKFIDRDINVFLKNKNALTAIVTMNGQSRPLNQLTESELINNWQENWADLLLPYHPENRNNCFIADCGKNAAADAYDNNFISTDNAAQARSRLFWFGDDYLSVINNDPYFKAGAEGATKKTSFTSRLVNFNSTGLDIMSFVRWSLYCQDKSTTNNFPATITACPRNAACNREEDEWALFRTLYYSAKQEIKDKNTTCNSADLFPDPSAAMIQVMDASTPVPASCTDAALFQVSNNNGVISIQYTGVQNIPQDITVDYFAVDNNNSVLPNSEATLVFHAGEPADATKTATGIAGLKYVINFARCDPGHPYYTKTRRNYNGVDMGAVANQVKTKTTADLNAGATTTMTNECNESCEQNADGWMQKLAGCNLDIKGTEYEQLRNGLIAVCKGSCQVNVQDHPFGASSVPVATSDGDKNFKDVLLRVLGAQRFSTLCNDLLLDYPAPIDAKPLYTNEVVRTLQPCAWNTLQTWKAAWQSAAGYSSFAGYIIKKIDPLFSLTDAEISSLEGTYQNNCVTALPLRLPASLSCSEIQNQACLTCSDLLDLQADFSVGYPYISRDDPDYFELFAQYINRKKNFNLSSVDVYQASQQCIASQSTLDADSVRCEDFTSAYQHFQQLQPGYFTDPNLHANADSIYQTHLTLWLNTELHHQLSFAYYQSLATSCNIAFDYPSSHFSPGCDSASVFINCAPQFITCCGLFSQMDKFRQVFPDSVDARLLALYFSLQRTQWCVPVNLPAIDYSLPYDSLTSYFNHFSLAGGYNIIVRPDSLISFTISDASTCRALAFNFKNDPPVNDNLLLYAVCNKPLQPFQPEDDNGCINQQVSSALANAHSDYLEYAEKIKRDYENAYYTKCLAITPRLTIEAVYNQPLEYHYTLFYYDQSGNLVKTVPPAGVQPLDEAPDGAEKMQRVKNYRLADNDDCYEYGDAPAMTGSASITVADNTLIRQNALPFTLEAFINFNNFSGDQVLFTKQSVNSADNRIDGYRVYLHNGRILVDYAAHGAEQWTQTLSKIVPYTPPAPFNTLPPVNIRVKQEIGIPRSLYRSLTAEITSDINGIVNSGTWVYVAVENTNDRNNPIDIYINGNLVSSRLITDNSNYTPASSPALSAADISAGTTEFSFSFSAVTVPLNVSNTNAGDLIIGASADGLNGSVKQVRLYNRALSSTEIRSNAFNTCLMPQNQGSLVLWLPLNKEEVASSSLDRVNQLNTINSNTIFSADFQPAYPTHRLPAHYDYNSLNTVVRQRNPDIGETNFFYDLAGRLAVSQNAEQKNSTRGETNNRYSYTKYDPLGRITETGEKIGVASMTTAIAKTDPLLPGSPLNTWLAGGTDQQVTQTIYDQPNTSIVTDIGITGSQNIYNTSRKRVVAVLYRNSSSTATDYNNATHYQYDINGNIKRLWQEHKKSVSGALVNLLKDFQYDYDLASGKVNRIIYQKDKGDQFVYKYEYDPENRLLRAYSGRDVNTLQQDAGYRYYLHGPLARVELGDVLTNRIVQGNDYVYTLQGWLKGLNGIQLSNAATSPAAADAGADGSPLTDAGIHSELGRDALAYELNYYQADYAPIGTGLLPFNAAYQHPAANANDPSGKELFNGNISSAVYSIDGINNGGSQGYSYGYDQLSRLREMRAHNLSAIGNANGWNNGSVLNEYKESFSYDANGNIAQLFRNGTGNGNRIVSMDDLSYHYYYYTVNNDRKTYAPGQPLPADAWVLTNQLSHISDAVPVTNYPSAAYPAEKDIDDQVPANYTYDGIGNLVKDNAEGITKIDWTVAGKIRSIEKLDGTNILYDYDASGNRIQKQVIAGNSKTITSYIRDAQGNTISVYGWKGSAGAMPPIGTAGNGLSGQTWDEQHLYGSSRLGMWRPNITVPVTLNTTTDAVQVGSKFFELTNHLGNVLAVISDRKMAIASVGNPAVTDHYEPDLISANDYTPFGMQMVGRAFRVSSSLYRYGFNGKENDNEAKGEGNEQDYGMRVYDGRVGRWLSPDPIIKPWLTSFNYAANNPINNIDPDGKDEIHFHFYTTITKGPGGFLIGGQTTARIEIIKAEGPDRYFHHNHGTTISLPTNYSKGGVSTFDHVTEFYPWNPDSRTGLTNSSFLELFNANDRDYATLIKYVSTSPDLKEYIRKRSIGYESSYYDKIGYQNLLRDIPIYNRVGQIKQGADMAFAMFSIVEDGIPLGFKSAAQFAEAGNELRIALEESGIGFKAIGVRGSSVTNISSKGGSFRFVRVGKLPKSDIDAFIELSGNVGLNSSKGIPGFIHPEKMMNKFPALEQWSNKWSEILGRKITPGAFNPGTFVDKKIINF